MLTDILQAIDGPMPAWASFMLKLGYICRKAMDQRLIVVVTCPDTTYAAPLCAAGAVIASAETARQNQGPVDHEGRFEYLLSQPLNTLVSVYDSTAGYCTLALMQGDRTRGEIRLVYAHNHVSILDKRSPAGLKKALKVFVIKQGPADYNLPQHNGRVFSVADKFAAGLFEGGYFSRFAAESATDCLVIGPIGEVQIAIEENAFFLEQENGCLCDILRPCFLADEIPASYRTVFLSDRQPLELPDRNAAAPPLILFNGASAFSKYRDVNNGNQVLESGNWLAILDRRDEDEIASAQEGIQSLLESRQPIPPDVAALFASLDIPPGIQLSAFVRRETSNW